MKNNRIQIAVSFDNDPLPPANIVALPVTKPVIRSIAKYKIGADGKVIRIASETLARIA